MDIPPWCELKFWPLCGHCPKALCMPDIFIGPFRDDEHFRFWATISEELAPNKIDWWPIIEILAGNLWRDMGDFDEFVDGIIRCIIEEYLHMFVNKEASEHMGRLIRKYGSSEPPVRKLVVLLTSVRVERIISIFQRFIQVY